ncbi:hypothetical protein ABH905_003006 [Pseudomonas frederiksbergensis]
MSTILDRYRLRREATARRASAEWAFSSRRLLPLAISPLSSITQPERDEALRHHAFPLRTTLSLSNLHHCPYPSPQASTPPNLNLFRRDNWLFAGDFSRDPKHSLFSYLLGALGMKVCVEPLSTWTPDIHVDEPMGGLMQIVILSDTRTRLVLGAHLCAGYAICEWVIGRVEALADHPIRRPGRTRAGINNYPRNEQTSPPTNQRSSAGSHKLKGLRPFAPKHVGEPLRYCLDNGPELDMSALYLRALAVSDVDQPSLTLSEPNQWLLDMIGKRQIRAIR